LAGVGGLEVGEEGLEVGEKGLEEEDLGVADLGGRKGIWRESNLKLVHGSYQHPCQQQLRAPIGALHLKAICQGWLLGSMLRKYPSCRCSRRIASRKQHSYFIPLMCTYFPSTLEI
jgi:hypothetical protein